jgi:LPXTG-motif cell wall-anchored protein
VLSFAVVAHADPLPAYEFHDLNDNLVPAGWTLQVPWGNGGIQDGKLYARIVDALAELHRVGTLPNGATWIKLEYDGNMAYSSNGMVNGVALMAGADTFAVNAGIRFGVQTHRVIIWKNSPYVPGGLIFDSSYALEYTDFHYAVEFTQGQIKYKAVKISDASTVFDIVVSDSRLDLTKVQEIAFSAYATTENDCWVDNLLIETGSQAIPTLTEWGLIIFGVVLLGFITWVFLKKRRKGIGVRL